MRALVSMFAGLLIIISLYQLSFTWFVNKHESAMEQKAERYIRNNFPAPEKKYPGDQDTRLLYKDTLNLLTHARLQKLLDSTKDTKITWWGTTYQKSKENELLLGLDLQGGINVTLDVALEGLVKGLANNQRDPMLLKTIQLADQKKLTSGGSNFIDLFAQAFKELNPTGSLAPLFANTNRNKLKYESSDAEVIRYLHQQASDGMKQTYQVLRNRIDKFGVAQPSINLDENKGIITVELAGATDPDRIRKYLQSTANLQFWEVYNIGELTNDIENADKVLQKYLNGIKDSSALAKTDSTADSTSSAMNQNPLLRLVRFIQPSQDSKGQVRYAAALGTPLLKDTALLNSYLSNPYVRNQFPSNLKFLYGKQETDDNGKFLPYLDLYAIKTIPGSEKAKLEGEVISDARQDYDPVSGGVVVDMTMYKRGADTWAKMTGDNVNKPIAIVLDDIVYSAPFVNGQITGGSSQITMGNKSSGSSVEEAQDLANILKSGKLNAPARIVQEQVVGPTLGKEAVHGGALAFAISFLVIFTLMLVYYNTAGWVANIALILNLLFTIGILSALHATLTAPGIAGLVLTIGMAVDTNVIIFERIKEELTRGKSYPIAVHDGYRRSLAPVLDAHVTTFLTAAILAYFGLGPVLGFATTQMLGIVLSLFCGILVSRLVTDFYTNKNRHFKYFTGVSRKIFRHASYKFIEYRKVTYGISVAVLILGISAYFHGFKKGVEFLGGRSYIVKFNKPIHDQAVRDSLNVHFGRATSVKTYGSNEQLEITTDYLVEQEGLSADSIVINKMFSGLKSFLPAGTTTGEFTQTNKFIQQSKKVGASISDDLKAGAVKATIFALLMIFIYIFIRFRDWRYSLGTIFSLLHDVLVTLAVFSFLPRFLPFPLEIDQHFIAAILTVIGFSMNDTVIVFDRIREDSRLLRGKTKGEIINKAVNETLSRTVMTSLTVFLTILILFLVGGEVTKGFAFAMLIGVVTGTYSSIFVAAPILMDLSPKRPLGAADTSSTPVVKAKPATAK
ncbi:MAG: protein translocase subunit SecDF [Bacteroidota bacterium]|nr:protein translocase subunit SecDF [Bacteroidota bacterium]MDP4212401.1 protein translocase subunit SecDF [Bacteroidota bacterium]MDP4251275.1 protein translocase subunit SecDF [Bacteroidota bacterium]